MPPVTLLLLIASLSLPAGLFGFMTWESHHEAMDAASHRVEQTAGILHENAQRVLEINASALERAVQYVALTQPRGAEPDRVRLHSHLVQIEQTSPAVQSLWVFAADGSVLGTSLPAWPPALNVADRDYFVHHRAQAAAGYFVSAPLLGRADGRQQFALTRRLEDLDGGFAGVVISGIQTEYFAQQWQALSPELDPTAMLVRDDGVVLARHPGLPVTAPPLPPDSAFMKAFRHAPAGTQEMVSAIDGKNRIVGFRRLAGYPVTIAYTVSVDAVLAGWYHLVLRYALVCGAVALALLAMTAVVHRRYRVEHRLVRRLQQTDAARTRFFANVSHELRTPLTLILGPAERLLERCASHGPEHRDLEVIQRSGKALLRRVDDLLDIARLEAGSVPVEYARVDLATLVRVACACFDSAVHDTGLALDVETPPTLMAELDAQKTERILFNLLSNAFKFTPAPGRVRVALTTEHDRACITVQDTGPGVPPHLREAVFHRFRQGDDGVPRAHGGTGLGLAIVREFAQLQDGSVTLDDAPGGGALFRVRLPLRAPAGTVLVGAPPSSLPADGWRAEHPLRAPLPPSAVASHGPLVLVVEDHPDMNAFIAQALAGRYRVVTAFDGQQGLEVALRDPSPDLIVLDVMMPGMSGESVLEQLRRVRKLRDVPVLMLTARAEDALHARLLRKGAQAFLQKPFDEEVLQERIARLLADRERAMALIHRSEQRLRGILETAKDAIIVTDSERRIVLFNKAAQEMFGYFADAVAGESMQMLVASDCWQNCLQPRDGDGCIRPEECGIGQGRRANGELFPVECSTSRLDDDGIFHTVILRDITVRVRDRQALVEAHEELQRVTQGFQRQLIAAVEARQARIARDLHDSVGASLAGVSLLIGAARAATAQERAALVLDKAQEQVAATAQAVRGISRGLMPAGTDSGGLRHALEQFASDFGQTSGVTCVLRARGNFTDIDAATATHVFRMVQEAATNAIRHGRARTLRIALCEAGGRCGVSVTDDGTGFDVSRLPRAHPGLGLRSMQARARAIDGELRITRRPGGGSRVRVTWSAAAARAQAKAADALPHRDAPEPVT